MKELFKLRAAAFSDDGFSQLQVAARSGQIGVFADKGGPIGALTQVFAILTDFGWHAVLSNGRDGKIFNIVFPFPLDVRNKHSKIS
jgi:hypothetical protein